MLFTNEMIVYKFWKIAPLTTPNNNYSKSYNSWVTSLSDKPLICSCTQENLQRGKLPWLEMTFNIQQKYIQILRQIKFVHTVNW